MRLLLDTHAILWWLDDSPELCDELKDLLDTEPAVDVSPITGTRSTAS
jgi:PIN domain nuclease of toxin-antitoxin system